MHVTRGKEGKKEEEKLAVELYDLTSMEMKMSAYS